MYTSSCQHACSTCAVHMAAGAAAGGARRAGKTGSTFVRKVGGRPHTGGSALTRDCCDFLTASSFPYHLHVADVGHANRRQTQRQFVTHLKRRTAAAKTRSLAQQNFQNRCGVAFKTTQKPCLKKQILHMLFNIIT